MKHQGPLLTLLAGGVLAAGIGGLSARAASQDSARQGEKGAASAASAPSAIAPSAAAPVPAATGQGQSPAAGQAGARQSPLVRPAKRDYAGYTRGGAATLAIAVRADKAIAYLCDGRVVESWLSGSATGGRFDMYGKHDAHLTGRVENGKITGSVVIRDLTFRFTVVGVKRPSGLYRLTAEVRGARLDGGWIVREDGSQVGLLDTDGTPAPAPRLDTATGSVDVNGQRVPAQEVTP
jgi:hypothetical protein